MSSLSRGCPRVTRAASNWFSITDLPKVRRPLYCAMLSAHPRRHGARSCWHPRRVASQRRCRGQPHCVTPYGVAGV
jgi:hypothetical protein